MRRHFAFSSIFLSLFTLQTAVFCDPVGLTLPELLAHMVAIQKRLQTIRFGFIEHSNAPDLRHSDIRGSVSFKQPHFIRLDQREPERQILWSDGTTLQIYTPLAGQVLRGSWSAYVTKAFLPRPLLSFMGDFPVDRWAEQYDMIFGGFDGKLYRLELKPKNSQMAALDLWISGETFLPVRCDVHQSQSILRVDVRDLRQNIPINESYFHPSIPKDTAIVPLPS